LLDLAAARPVRGRFRLSVTVGEEKMSEREQDQVKESVAADGEWPEGAEENGEAGGDARDGELRALEERLLRLAAEFDNFRKRTERERAESWARAQAQLLERLLDPLDDLRRVLDTEGDASAAEAVREGVRLVEAKLSRSLESAGLAMVGVSGEPFDPELHEALMTGSAPTPEADGTVGQVLQRGYTFKGMLLRPARVQVLEYAG
jgi:molecular chaperone GrpE